MVSDCYQTPIVQSSISQWLNSSFLTLDETITSITIQDPSGTWDNGNERVLHIPQTSRTEASPSHCLLSNQGHPLELVGYPSVEVYSTVSAWSVLRFIIHSKIIFETGTIITVKPIKRKVFFNSFLEL